MSEYPTWPNPDNFTAGDQPTELQWDKWWETFWHLRQRGDHELTLSGATAAQPGFVAAQDTGAAQTVALVSTAGLATPVVVALAPVTAGTAGYWRGHGWAFVYTADAVAVGDFLQTSTTAGQAIVGTTNAFAQAYTAKSAGAGTVLAWLHRPAGTGSVTSVALTVPAEWSVAGSPVTTSGTLAVSKATQAANQVWAGPASGSAAAPAFRALALADLPTAPVVQVTHSANQSVANLTNTVLAWDTERWDSHGQHDNVTNNSHLVCQVAGTYRVYASIAFATGAGGLRDLGLLKNGASVVGFHRGFPAGGAGATVLVCAFPDVQLAVNDVLQVRAQQDSGGALNVLFPADYAAFGWQWIGP